MLLFIFKRFFDVLKVSGFQYISCYCLSVIAQFSGVNCFHFNTSHVTVYPAECELDTGSRNISIHLMLLFIDGVCGYAMFELIFQYISCYCLSLPAPDSLDYCIISIHLMLLFIEIVIDKQQMDIHFNTSHVTVYHIFFCWCRCSYSISIHLMLLFI